MSRPSARIDYEDLRRARILENKARLDTLGLQKTISDLRSAASVKKLARINVWKPAKKVCSFGPLRRSDRLKGQSVQGGNNSVRCSYRLKRIETQINPSPVSACQRRKAETLVDGHVITPANKPLLKIENMDYQISPEASARRCNSKGRGSVYDPIFGICCHFCRQKKLCGEEDCKRCNNFDLNEPCIGKTDCSVCHSSFGVFCRACLKVRYGEEMEEVRENKKWMCPHCVEAKGLKPFWICNSSLCLKKRRMMPTGLAIFRAREMGYESVAHLLMDELQRTSKCRK
ncbi:hypothetical protein SAY86_016365 [Trapa natans]|nr:hypothetical protein SAY86_016365 [Trapa natans]